MTTLTIPKPALVLLLGPSGAGKSTFAAKHFAPTEVLSSDRCRALVADDESAQDATRDAFAVLQFIARRRLARGLTTVIDATNVKAEARAPLLGLAHAFRVPAVAVALDVSADVCDERNAVRPGRGFGRHVVEGHAGLLRESLRGLRHEGFAAVYVLSGPEAIDGALIERSAPAHNHRGRPEAGGGAALERRPPPHDRRADRGPFDIIGDVHGCFDELATLLAKLGYRIDERLDGTDGRRYQVAPPPGRKAIFLGDLVDRGPRIPDVLRLVMGMVEDGTALCVPGNHEMKLLKKLRGRDVRVGHGLAETLAQLDAEPPAFVARVARFIEGLVTHYRLDGGHLVVAHAGLPAALHGRDSERVRSFVLYGDTTGKTDEHGLPVRLPWARDYRGEAAVVYGHTPILEPTWVNRTLCIDTGCVFGGRLTALRYPERELVSTPAAAVYCAPPRPLAAAV